MSNALSRKALCNAPAPYLPSRGKPFQTRPTVLVRLQLVPWSIKVRLYPRFLTVITKTVY